MELLEYIEILNKNTYIKVGSNKGGGFLYCGKAGDFSKWFKNEDVNNRERQKLENIIEAKKGNLASFECNWSKKLDRLTKEYETAKKEGKKDRRFKAFNTIEEYTEHLTKEKEKHFTNLTNLLSYYENRLADFTPIENRDVVETYDSILLNEDGYIDHIIIYSGLEMSRIWDLTEFRHGVQNEDLEGVE